MLGHRRFLGFKVLLLVHIAHVGIPRSARVAQRGEDLVGRPLRRYLRDAGRNAELTVAIHGDFFYQCLDLRG